MKKQANPGSHLENRGGTVLKWKVFTRNREIKTVSSFHLLKQIIFCHDNSQIILQKPNPSKHTLSTASYRHRTNSTFPVSLTPIGTICCSIIHVHQIWFNCWYCWMQSFNSDFLKSSLSLYAKKERFLSQRFEMLR